MPLWRNRDLASGNQKPIFANTSNSTSNSTINGTVANTNAYYGNMVGVSAAEIAASPNPHKPQHAGWNSQKIGTGGIAKIEILSGGQGYNANGFLTVTDNSYLKAGVANIRYAIANAQNTLQNSSSNALNNTITSLTVVSSSGFSNVSAITVGAIGSNIAPATFRITLGGRAGRVQYETIVAMGSITDDDPTDNVYFSGV